MMCEEEMALRSEGRGEEEGNNEEYNEGTT